MRRLYLPLVVAIAVSGWVIRAFPLLYFGARESIVDYDEGVYFAAVALFSHGALPYRDFIYVHPSGFLYLWSILLGYWSHSDPAVGFAVARWLNTMIGAINIGLIGWVATVSFGRCAGLAAASLYAVSLFTVWTERSLMLEPSLNLACLGLAGCWLGGSREMSRTRACAAGALLATAITIKLWGALWIIPCLASLPPRFSRKQLCAFLAGAVVASLLLLGIPFANAPKAFWDQIVLFQFWRPPDGVNRVVRVLFMISVRPTYVLSTASAIAGLCVVLYRGRHATRTERFVAAAWGSIFILFLISKTFFEHYLAHLMVPGALLGGLSISVLVRWASTKRARVQVALAVVCMSAWTYSTARVMLLPVRAPWLLQIGQTVAKVVPAHASLLAFEPAWAISGGRLPTAAPGTLVMLDPYADMIYAAVENGARFPNVVSALHSDAAQRRLRAVLEDSDFVILGRRGRRQSSPDTMAWLRAHYISRSPYQDTDALDLWERVPAERR